MGATAPATTREALDMVRAGLGYLAAADAAQLPAATQAECLRELEQADAAATAARASILSSFAAGQGYSGDGDYSAVSWLIHRTGVTRGAAVGHSAWAKRAATHPRVLAALAAGQVPEPVGPAAACEVHHTKHKADGGKTSVTDCVLLCPFHHQIVIHRWGWTLVLNPDGTTTAWNKDKTKTLHSHGPPTRAG
jgi:hypothetical protein